MGVTVFDASGRPVTNGTSKVAFSFGLMALVLSFIPEIGFVSFWLAPIAVVFGLIALNRPSKGLAIAGITAAASALLVPFVYI